jgi:predicted enzyme related to lactoylglutathione lyase
MTQEINALRKFNVEGITWHAITLEGEKFKAFKQLVTDVFGLTPAMEMDGMSMFPMPNGTILELYKQGATPPYGYNSAIAFGFRVNDIEAAVKELKEAGYTFLGDIVRVPEYKYAYCHFQGPDDLVYGLNEQK